MKEERKSTFFEEKGQVEYMLQFFLDAFSSTLFIKGKSRIQGGRAARNFEFSKIGHFCSRRLELVL